MIARFFTIIFLTLLTSCSLFSAPKIPEPEVTVPPPPAYDPVERAVTSTVMVQDVEGETFCSGTIIKNTGIILSAAHCYEIGEPVFMRWQERSFTATLLYINRIQDLATLRPDQFQISPDAGVELVELAPRQSARVFLLGHALGDRFPFTMTSGIVSHPRRLGTVFHELQLWTQVDAPMWGGMSGGGAYDAHGNLFGVNLFGMLNFTGCIFPGCEPQWQETDIKGVAHFEAVQAIMRTSQGQE